MSVLDAIGNTPLVRLDHVNPNPRVSLLAKLEGSNPGGSVKDRIALEMVRDGLDRGALRPGQTILEATSGNTGIGLAMVGAALGVPVKLTMPECVSMERRRTLEAFGAHLVL
jgi:cysteine synthase B